MHSDTASALGSDVTGIQDALASNDIRARDYWLMQTADAQAGKVLRDRNGVWVRTQQYVLRPDEKTVQLLNVSLRGGTGAHAGITSLDFVTFLNNTLPDDLTSLPWDQWLTTVSGDGIYLYDYTDNPYFLDLDRMSITLTAPNTDSFQETREVGNGISETGWAQLAILQDTLTYDLDGVSGSYTNSYFNDVQYYVESSPGTLRYAEANEGDATIANIDIYNLPNDFDINNNEGPLAKTGLPFDDIWDVLRVDWIVGDGGPIIGTNNIELAVRQGDSLNVAIDALYIPMSHMLWRN